MKRKSLVRRAILCLFMGCFVLSAAGLAPAQHLERSGSTADNQDRELLIARLADIPLEARKALSRSKYEVPDALLDQVFRLEHDVPVAPGRTIHLYESFTLRSFLRRGPNRAILMIPGPITTGDFFNIPVDGYDGGAIMARRGFFAFAADLEGSGRSSFPQDGRVPTYQRQLENLIAVADYIRLIRLAPKVDLLGESWGGNLAAEMAGDRARFRSCVMTSMLYRTPSAELLALAINPAFHAFLDSLTDGYFPTTAPFYDQFLTLSPQAVADVTHATQAGRYASAPEYALFNLPFFDPGVARVPGLIIKGEFDPSVPPSDTVDLSLNYGTSGAQLIVLPGSMHVPRIESAPTNETFWNLIIKFVDPS